MPDPINNLPCLVASDLDGTLLRGDKRVSTRTVAVLDALTRRGIPFVMVTARPVRWLATVLDQIGAHGPVICANGAVVYDPATGTVLRADLLAPALLYEVAATLRAALPDVSFAAEVDHSRLMTYEPAWPLNDPHLTAPAHEDATLLGRPAAKLLARSDHHTAAELAAIVAGHLGDTVTVTWSGRVGTVEISAAGVTKARALAWLAARLGIHPSGAIAFGDMPNDLPMLAWAGRGVAVANADPTVLAAATHTTTSNNDDGVAAYLEPLLP